MNSKEVLKKLEQLGIKKEYIETLRYDIEQLERLKYKVVDEEKLDSLGQQMTIKEALNLHWNCVVVRDTDNDIYNCWMCSDGSYETDGLELDTLIELDDEYDYDSDNNPIICANVVKKEGDEK